MHSPTSLPLCPLFLPLLWSASGLADNSLSARPSNLTTTPGSTTQCTHSTFTVADGESSSIAVGDCQALLAGWTSAGPFTLLAAEWIDSSNDADQFHVYVTQLSACLNSSQYLLDLTCANTRGPFFQGLLRVRLQEDRWYRQYGSVSIIPAHLSQLAPRCRS